VPALADRVSIHHVLVVDDEADAAHMVARILEAAGYDVITATSGADALAFLQRAPWPCLLLLDLQMADMNGWEVLSTIRAARNADHPIIVMSGMERPSVPRGLRYLKKPFGAKQLLETVRAELDERRFATSSVSGTR
jgi:DNA-binding response OmpR family regulator